jgi:hypothetical protein
VDLWIAFTPMDFERSCHWLTSGQPTASFAH